MGLRKNMSTIFTKIINKEIPADILFEDDDVLAFRDINPQAPIHFLVIPKKEIRTLNDIEENDKNLIGKLFIIAKQLAKSEGISEDGYRTIFNCNEHGAQTVYHIHLHVLGGRQMTWPPG
tara:strand:- start:53 stop:412 length:360 start_codon:yes stop_codon:yes gene_type:complete